ncbi:aldo/keto reductase [Alteribacillus iranensis]|uniref:Predicted oxidoreductase n=1 Tax=Alteribacillus iranensis TaxID=930128 RepID=A0A1I2E1E2_9BACI|nr:aldo/keto reductase [Alteribacillus iranensis]SFE86487.1 Predicted oxidoreductase [Alteribacillus iranensis]
MKYRTLGKTEMTVSVIGLGTWQFGGEWGRDYTQKEVDAIFDKARETGINFIDTAECYGDHLSEKFIGEAIKNDRENWVLATKFGHQFHGFYDRTHHYKPEEVLKQLDDSLRALQTDYIDLYQFHSGGDEYFDNDDLWTMLDKQVEAGKIRHLGTSIAKNNNTFQTEKTPSFNASTLQVVYNRLDRTPEEEVFPICEEHKLGVMARVPLASGFLSGKYKPGTTFQENDIRSVRDREETERKLALAAEIQKNEVPEHIPMAQWALAWCLKHPAVSCVIPGCKNPEQVASNAEAANLEMVYENHPQAVSP